MSYQGLVRNNNLSDIGNASQAWDNIGSNLSYNYGAIRGNFVDNSAIISQADKSNVVVTQDSGVTLSYGSQYVYRITEASGAPTPYSFGWLVAANTSISYTDISRRLNVNNGPIVGSILLKAGVNSHYSVAMALRPAYGGNFFKQTNFPAIGVNLRTGQFQDAFGNKQPYELMGVQEEDDGWWRVTMSSICQQAYSAASIQLFFLKNGTLNVIENASSTDGSKFFYAALPQIEPGHEPSPIIITFNDQPNNRQTSAVSSADISFKGQDIDTIRGLSEVGQQNILQVASLLSPAQPRISALASSGNSLSLANSDRLRTASPSSTGNYVLSGLVASGYQVGGNNIGSVSGSPFSGSTAIVPLRVGAFIPQAWKANTAFASGSLASPSIAIPIEYNDFYVTIIAGQS